MTYDYSFEGKNMRRASQTWQDKSILPTFVVPTRVNIESAWASYRKWPYFIPMTAGVVFLLLELLFRLVPWAMGAPPEFPLEDPYRAWGHLEFDPNQPLESHWVPYDTPEKKWGPVPNWVTIFRLAGNLAYPPDTSWNVAQPGFGFDPNPGALPLDEYPEHTREYVRRRNLDRISHLRNTTILLLGDSVDRNAVDQFGWLFQTRVNHESFDGSGFDPRDPPTWGYPHVLHFGGDLNLTLASAFFYGSADDVDDFSFAPDWIPPGRAEERITQLFKPLADRMPTPPSLIQLHSGMWDLAFWGRQDKFSGQDTNLPLSDERLEKYQARLSSTIQQVKKTWPGVPIVFRKIHRSGPTDAARDWQDPDSGFVNYFTDIRFHQLRHMEEIVAAKEGVAVWDFGEIYEGFQQYQERVHPKLYPGGTIMWNGLMHHAFLAKYQSQLNTTAEDGPMFHDGPPGGFMKHSKTAKGIASIWAYTRAKAEEEEMRRFPPPPPRHER